MARQPLSLFMWGYQPHFRHSIEYLAREVLKRLGISVDAAALLVGVRRPGHVNPNPVCIEPADGQWPLVLFDELVSDVEKIYSNHHLQTMFYGDEASMRDKPEWMRRDSVTTAVRRALIPFDERQGVRSFVGQARPVGDFYVAPVIQVPETLFRKFPPLKARVPKDKFDRGSGYPSLIHAALSTVLDEATSALEGPDPGRSVRGEMRKADEIVRLAAKAFMHTPGLAISDRYMYTDLFDRLNLISSLLYEGARGVGRLLLANSQHPGIEYLLRFQTPVRIHDPRWTRKVLQLAGPSAALVADSEYVYGLGHLLSSHDQEDQSVFTIDFLDHYTWELRSGELVLLRSLYGEPSLPSEIIESDVFISNLARMFPTSTEATRTRFWQLFNAAAHQKMGSMIVIAEDAESEALRLDAQGTSIQPVALSVELLLQASAIDGSILIDPQGYCHAIGVILDGLANDQCTPSRGSRFNSAVRYVRSGTARRLAIIVSEDRTVDVFPVVRARQSRKEIDDYVSALVAASVDNYHVSMNWLYSHRFYLNPQQCIDINAALARLDAAPREVGEIRFLRDPFSVDPEFDDSYLID
ncbi:hypothetical protein PIN31009_02341 [Pandoraea iniqua]|nr:hypothetical protein PIN31009_02341 [Pandoraea iniqua]